MPPKGICGSEPCVGPFTRTTPARFRRTNSSARWIDDVWITPESLYLDEPYRLIEIFYAIKRDNRSKKLFLRNFVFRRYSFQNRRRHKISFFIFLTRKAIPAGKDYYASFLGSPYRV